jgi:uroporphyrinogen-III synthase
MHMARQSTGNAIPVLLTRPKAQSRAFAGALNARFGPRVRAVITPLMAPVYLTPTLPEGPFAAVILTSATGVEAAARLGVPLPKRAFCVGSQTAAQARVAGFQATSADGDASALVAAVLADPPPGRLLHLRGEDTRGDVAERLISAGLETESVALYRQEAQPLTAEAVEILLQPGPVILPVFSPRTATLLRAALPNGLCAELLLAAMSNAVAEALTGLPHAVLELARRPDADAMQDAVGRLLELRSAP